MREIKFRAKTKGTNEWVYGHYALYMNVPQILVREERECGGVEGCSGLCDVWYEIDYKTLGQYMGINDKKDVEIYDGDIVLYKPNGYKYCVEFSNLNHWWCFVQIRDTNIYTGGIKGQGMRYCEVIGNIYEHPHLLKGGNNERESKNEII